MSSCRVLIQSQVQSRQSRGDVELWKCYVVKLQQQGSSACWHVDSTFHISRKFVPGHSFSCALFNHFSEIQFRKKKQKKQQQHSLMGRSQMPLDPSKTNSPWISQNVKPMFSMNPFPPLLHPPLFVARRRIWGDNGRYVFQPFVLMQAVREFRWNRAMDYFQKSDCLQSRPINQSIPNKLSYVDYLLPERAKWLPVFAVKVLIIYDSQD